METDLFKIFADLENDLIKSGPQRSTNSGIWSQVPAKCQVTASGRILVPKPALINSSLQLRAVSFEDVKKTKAYIKKNSAKFKFNYNVELEEGIKKFSNWFFNEKNK